MEAFMTFEVSDDDRELFIKALEHYHAYTSPAKARTSGTKSWQAA
jgi:hypothetical protein